VDGGVGLYWWWSALKSRIAKLELKFAKLDSRGLRANWNGRTRGKYCDSSSLHTESTDNIRIDQTYFMKRSNLKQVSYKQNTFMKTSNSTSAYNKTL
jgi:hypothetical protein